MWRISTMKHDEIVGFVGSAFGTVMTAIQANEVLQIVQAILTVIGLLITIAYTIWKWYKKAKADGKITEDEVDELMDDLNKIKEDKDDGNN